MTNKLLVILGPNASGKSDLAIRIAKKFNGEIVSADSRQVYKGMDIGSGKVPPDTRLKTKKVGYYSKGIRHHLLDVADPQQYFSVVLYQKLAQKAIKDIQIRNKLPILCGGTGLYLSAIIEGWQFPAVPPNNKLRQKLSRFSLEALYQKLKAIAPQRAKNIDKNNKRRLVRALEIALSLGNIEPLKKVPPYYDIFILGIKRKEKELKKRITERLNKRLAQGMVEEVKKLKAAGISSQRLDDFGLEYRWVNRYLENKITFSEMREKLLKDIWRYAKRQMTWFKKIQNIHWIQTPEEAIRLIGKWTNQ